MSYKERKLRAAARKFKKGITQKAIKKFNQAMGTDYKGIKETRSYFNENREKYNLPAKPKVALAPEKNYTIKDFGTFNNPTTDRISASPTMGFTVKKNKAKQRMAAPVHTTETTGYLREIKK